MAEDENVKATEPVAEPAAPAAPGAPVEVLAPKERRQRARAAKAASVRRRAPRSPQERHEDRVTDRARKAELRRKERERARAKAAATRGPTPAAATTPREHVPGVQKTRQGVVVSDRAQKTITVRIDVARRHRRYEKIVRTSRTLHVHDENDDARVGDTVIVRECRPLSRTKHWRLVEIIERAQ